MRPAAIVVLLAALALVGFGPGLALAADEPVTVEYFWGEGCPYCVQQAAFLDELEARHPDVVVERYEVWSDEANQQRMADALAAFGEQPTGVPATVIGDRYWVGFNERIATDIEQAVEAGSTVTVAPEVSTGPNGDGEPEALADSGGDAESAGVAIGLGVAALLAAIVAGGLVLRSRRSA